MENLMEVITFWGGVALIIAGICEKKWAAAKGIRMGIFKRLHIFLIIAGILLLGLCSGISAEKTHGDANKANDLVRSHKAVVYINGEKQKDYKSNLDVYSFLEVKVKGNKVYLTEDTED